MLEFRQEMENGVDIGWATNSAYSTPFSKEIYLEARKYLNCFFFPQNS